MKKDNEKAEAREAKKIRNHLGKDIKEAKKSIKEDKALRRSVK